MISFVRAVVISLILLVGGCATVTRTKTLETDAARGWLRETGDQRIRVDAPSDVTATGHVVAATTQSLNLQVADGRTIEIPLRDGATLRERRRGIGATVGAFAGIGIGLVTGLVLDSALATRNPDSAGGKEHPPLVIPLGVLAGALVGATVGAIIGTERRLEVDPNSK
jgi:hypothetical protein